MNRMKTKRSSRPLLWIFASLGLAVALLLRFANPDRYRPLLIQELEKSLGVPVSMERVRVGWQGGIAIQLQGLAVYQDRAAQQNRQPAIQTRKASAVLELGPLLRRELKVRSILLDGSISLAPPGQPGFQGKFSSSFDVSGKEILKTKDVKDLTAAGRIRLEEARLTDLNLLRELFTQLTLIPGLTSTLLSRLPPSVREKLAARDTVLEPVDLRVMLQRGELFFEDFRVATDTFELIGSARVGLDGTVNLPAQIRIEPALSGAVVRSVEELRPLADEQGHLMMPVLVRGRLPKLSVVPDLGYVTRRIFTSKAEDLLGGLLERVLEKNSE